MAIDTAAKRFSMMNFGTQPIFPLFIPDGSVDEGDRLHLLTLYSGISLISVSPPVFSGALSNLDISANRTKTVDYSGHFSNATSYSISPSVESGWSFNVLTGVLVVLEGTVTQYGSYVITGTNSGGSDSSNAFYINIRAGSVGGGFGGRSLSSYEEEVALILKKEKEEALKEKKSLKAKEARLEVKISEEKERNRQTEETRLKYLQVSKSLLRIERDLAVISKKRDEINKRARILKDDDEVMMLLMSKGFL